jgi:hypothetical protein
VAETSWPGPGPATITERQWEALAEPMRSGLLGSPLDPPPVYGDSTGMHVKVRAGTRAYVRGHVWEAGDTDLQLSIAPNGSPSPRIDLVVLRLDRSAWTVTAEVVQGTPGGGTPAVSTDTGDTGKWELVIGRVVVPAGESTTITAGMVAARTAYLGPGLQVADTGQPLSQPGDYPYRLRYAPTQDRLMLERPSGTVDLYRDTGWVSLGAPETGWSALEPSYVRRVGPVVVLRLGNFERAGGSVASNADSRLLRNQLPGEFRWTGPEETSFVVLIGTAAARVTVYPSGAGARSNQIWLTDHSGVSTGQRLWGTNVTWMAV